MKRLIAAAVVAGGMLAGMVSAASAATVTPTNSVTFAFDVSSLGAFTVRAGTFGTGGLSCAEVIDCSLARSATLQFDFGTSIGGNELGTAYYYNNTSFDAMSAGGGIFGENPKSNLPLKYFDIDALLNVFYISVVYYDDTYSIGRLYVNDRSTGATIRVDGVEIPPVPLPAGAWLLLSALGGLGFAGWRRRKAVAA